MAFPNRRPRPGSAPTGGTSAATNDALRNECHQLLEKWDKQYPPSTVEYVPSGSIALDYLFGGGFPLAKVVLFTSAPALGKTLVALSMAKAMLEHQPGHVLYLDAEKSCDQTLIDKVVGPENKHRVMLHTPPMYEVVEEMIRDYSTVKDSRLLLVVIDSVTALQTKAVLEEGNQRLGAKSGYEGLFCLKMKLQSSTNRFGIIYLNQQRANISTGPGGGHGPATKAAGGWALKHYCDFNVEMKAASFIRDAGQNKVGVCAHIHCEKNRIVGNRGCYLYLKYGVGISNIATLISILKHRKLVNQAGSFFKVNCQEMGLGEDKNVQGNSGLDSFVMENFETLTNFIKNSPAILDDYFQTFKP